MLLLLLLIGLEEESECKKPLYNANLPVKSGEDLAFHDELTTYRKF